jgi:hypothetical protein
MRHSTNGRRAVVAVMLPREHLPFIRDWCRNNAEQGWETFLYDNTGSIGATRVTGTYNTTRWSPSGRDARGHDYGAYTSTLTDDEVQDELQRSVRGLPVTIVRWDPRDSDGNVLFEQVEAYVDFIRRYRTRIDWAAFLDCDEYLYSSPGFTWDELLAAAADAGCHRILLQGTSAESRWTADGVPRAVETLRSASLQEGGHKNIVRLSEVLRADIHWAWSLRGEPIRAEPDPRQFGFRHYNLPDQPDLGLEVVRGELRTFIDESVAISDDSVKAATPPSGQLWRRGS